MESRVYQARWLLAPVFGLCLGFLTVGVFFGT